IANGSMDIFFGAFFLFFINCIFIAVATLLLVSYIDPPHKRFVSEALERKVKHYIYAVVFATVLPSVYLAYGLVTREVFISRANEYIKKELVFENGFIAKQTISAVERVIDITLVGQKVSDERLTELSKKLEKYRMPNAKLIVHQTVIKELDEATLKKTLLSEVLNSNQQEFDSKNSQLADLQNELAGLRAQQGQQDDYQQEQKKIFDELVAQYPQVENLAIAKTNEYQTTPAAVSTVLLLNLTSKKALSREDRRKISAWLKVRTGVDQVKLSINTH
ncbi:MAG: TIGR00341 family protein, partial [Gallionella sp.]|nr:TIGR00341 family protein [Gallionella sp.]